MVLLSILFILFLKIFATICSHRQHTGLVGALVQSMILILDRVDRQFYVTAVIPQPFYYITISLQSQRYIEVSTSTTCFACGHGGK